MKPPEHNGSAPAIYEFCIDTCAYSPPLEKAIETLHQIYKRIGGKKVEYVCPEQTMRELGNAANPRILMASRRATRKMGGGDSFRTRPRTDFAEFVERNADWISCVETEHCRVFKSVLIDKAIPGTIIPLIDFVQGHEQLTRSGEEQWYALWEPLLERLKKSEKNTLPFDPRFGVYKNAVSQVRKAAYAMMRETASSEELAARGYLAHNDVKLINPETRVIDDDYVIQALRNNQNLWSLVSKHQSLIGAHHNCADRAILAYLFNTLSQKADAGDRRLVVVTDDGPMRETFADFAAGTKTKEGEIRPTPLEPGDYAELFLRIPERIASHNVETSNTVAGFFENQIRTINRDYRVHDTPTRNLLQKLATQCVEIRNHAKEKFYSGPSLNDSYARMVEQRSRSGTTSEIPVQR